MQDLTQGPIPRHLLLMAAPIAIGMLFQMLYYLIDLYFVAQLGEAAIAGVGAAGNLQFLVMAATQVLGVGTMALIANAVGRKDAADANLVFNQGLSLALVFTAGTLAAGYLFGDGYMRGLGADAATAAAGMEYLWWVLPGMSLQFVFTVVVSGLRGTGIVKPTMLVQIVTVVLNALLAPILISGWLTGRPLGVAGAGLATTLAVLAGFALLAVYFVREEKYIAIRREMLAVRTEVWKRILAIGLPPGGEFALMFVYMAVIYWVTRGFGADAQAGFGVGIRVMQSIFLPAMAIAFATAPVAGQNMGAGHHDRVRETFRAAAIMSTVVMLLLTIVCQVHPVLFVRVLTIDPEVVAVAAGFLGIISFNFVASGLIFSGQGMFQALGNTVPSLVASATRLVTFAVPALWLSRQPGFELTQLWWLSVATMTLQAILVLVFLKREFGRKLQPPGTPAALEMGTGTVKPS